jgi:hypothetical protein
LRISAIEGEKFRLVFHFSDLTENPKVRVSLSSFSEERETKSLQNCVIDDHSIGTPDRDATLFLQRLDELLVRICDLLLDFAKTLAGHHRIIETQTREEVCEKDSTTVNLKLPLKAAVVERSL